MESIDLTAAAASAAASAAKAVTGTVANSTTKLGSDTLEGALDGTVVGADANITVVPSTGVTVAGATLGSSTVAAAYDSSLVPLMTTVTGTKLNMAPLSESSGERSSVALALLGGAVLAAMMCLQ